MKTLLLPNRFKRNALFLQLYSYFETY